MQKTSSHDGSIVPHVLDATLADDQREHERHITICRLAKLKAGEKEGWAVVKNLSESGMMLEVHPSFDLDDIVTIHLSEDQHLTGTVRWRKDTAVGVHFFKAIDVTEILKKPTTKQNGKLTRLPRVKVNCPIEIKANVKTISSVIMDISPGGLCVKSDHPFEIAERVALSIPKLPRIIGHIRWQARGFVGIAFQQRVNIPDLTAWLLDYYDAAADNQAPLEYHISGYDERGKCARIAIVWSARNALLHMKAASKYFYPISVTDEKGYEIQRSAIIRRAFEEKAAITSLTSRFSESAIKTLPRNVSKLIHPASSLPKRLGRSA